MWAHKDQDRQANTAASARRLPVIRHRDPRPCSMLVLDEVGLIELHKAREDVGRRRGSSTAPTCGARRS